jgi:hypothetical protein
MPPPVTPPYRRIYFDSNLMIRANWPSLGQTIQNAFALASFFSTASVLLDAVEKELEAHWKRDYRKTFHEAVGKVAGLKKLGDQIGIEVPSQLPGESDVHEAYRATVEQLVAEHGLVRAAPPLRHTAELFDMAIRHAKPFKEKGKNFQDAVICLAAIDDLAALPGKRGALVSRDDIFDQNTVDAFCKPLGVDLKLFVNEDLLIADLRSFVTASMSYEWGEEEKLAMTAVRENQSRLEAFIAENLEISPRLGFLDRIISISRIDIEEVTKVETPVPWTIPTDETVAVKITATIQLGIHARVRRHQTSPELMPNIRVGKAPVGNEGVFRPRRTEEREEVLKRTVTVEMRATRENGTYTGLEPTSLALTTSQFAKIGSLLSPIPGFEP